MCYNINMIDNHKGQNKMTEDEYEQLEWYKSNMQKLDSLINEAITVRDSARDTFNNYKNPDRIADANSEIAIILTKYLGEFFDG
jgi:hypothetical protein